MSVILTFFALSLHRRSINSPFNLKYSKLISSILWVKLHHSSKNAHCPLNTYVYIHVINAILPIAYASNPIHQIITINHQGTHVSMIYGVIFILGSSERSCNFNSSLICHRIQDSNSTLFYIDQFKALSSL